MFHVFVRVRVCKRRCLSAYRMNGSSPLRVFEMRCSEGFRAVHLEMRGWDGYWHGSSRRATKARQGGGVAGMSASARAVHPSGRSAAAGGEVLSFSEPPSEELHGGPRYFYHMRVRCVALPPQAFVRCATNKYVPCGGIHRSMCVLSRTLRGRGKLM